MMMAPGHPLSLLLFRRQAPALKTIDSFAFL
jgi:hypothetical protein